MQAPAPGLELGGDVRRDAICCGVKVKGGKTNKIKEANNHENGGKCRKADRKIDGEMLSRFKTEGGV